MLTDVYSKVIQTPKGQVEINLNQKYLPRFVIQNTLYAILE